MGNSDQDAEQQLQRFRTAAKDAGVKLTHQRLEIFREIASSIEHPDAEMVFRSVQVRVPTVSLDTVYRTLWLLNDLGLITTHGARRDSVRFDANLASHHHSVCVRCGLVRDFESARLDVLPVPASVKRFGTVARAHVEVRGTCEKCTKARPGPSAKKPKPSPETKRSKR